jgi:group I intron endonuclease
MKECYGVIYCIRNKINGKLYIGQTIKKGRAYEYYAGSGTALGKAYKKYGETSFTKKIILDYAKSKEELDYLETLYIEMFGTFCFGGVGYNIDYLSTGKGKRSEPSRKKNSISTKGKNGYWYGKHLTEETKNKIRLAHMGKILSEEHKKKIGEKSKGRTHSEEYKKKTSESKKGKNNPMYGKKEQAEHIEARMALVRKKIRCLEINKVFNSIKDASKELGVCRSSISSMLVGRYKSAKGFHFELVK